MFFFFFRHGIVSIRGHPTSSILDITSEEHNIYQDPWRQGESATLEKQMEFDDLCHLFDFFFVAS